MKFYFWFALVLGLVLVYVLNFFFFFLCEKFGALHACNLESNFDLLTLFIAHFIDDFFEDLVIVAMLVSFYT